MSVEETAPTGVATEPRGGIEHRRLKSQIRTALFGKGADPVKIGHFTVLKRLGVGGMGVVYSAYDDELDRKVAIKLLLPDQLGEEGHERLRREAQAVAKLSHPNVVNVYETGEHEGQLFVAMEFVRGQTLRAWVAGSERAWRDVLAIFLQAGRGLQAAHAAGLVHRDFKPDNVMVGDDGRVRVLDFGVARTVAEPHESANGPPAGTKSEELALTRTGAAVGTPAYMAPEQHAGAKADARTDQYAFCLAFWEALYGEYPFEATSFLALARSKSGGAIPAPARAGDVPAALRRLLERGLSPKADERHPSMDSLLSVLGRMRRGRRRFVPALVLAAAVGGAVATFALVNDESCVSADDKLTDAWDAKKARDALRSRSEPGLGDAWLELEPKLTDYATRWRTAYDQACSGSDDVDEEESLQRRRCLEAGLSTLRETTAALDVADVAALKIAAAGATHWLDPRDCVDSSLLQAWAERDALRKSPPPRGSEKGLVSDFETAPAATYGVGWVISKDQIAGGTSEADLSIVEGGAGGSGHALMVAGEVKRWQGEDGFGGAMFMPGETPFGPVNFSEKSLLSFDMRATPGTHKVMLFTQSTGWNPQQLLIEVAEDWTHIEVELDDFPVERYDATGIFIGRVEPGLFELRIDNVRID